MCDEYNSVFLRLFSTVLPECFVFLTDEEKEAYVYDFLCCPSLYSSFPFHCLITVIQERKNASTQKLQSPMHFHFLKRLLSTRITAILEEITSENRFSGVEQMLCSEYYTDVANMLLHTSDIVCNALSTTAPSFFLPANYNPWIAGKLLIVYLGFAEDRDASLYVSLVSKACMLGLTKCIADSIYRSLQCIDRKTEVTREERVLLVNGAHSVQSIIQFAHFMPDMRYREYVDELLTSHFSAPNPVFIH